MASERAKELAAKQKAEVQAEKERRRASEDPRDWGQVRQLREMFSLVRKQNPSSVWILLGAFLLPVVLFTVLGLFVKPLVLWILVGVMAGVALALFLFNRQVRSAAITRHEGQAGSAEVALSMLGKDWQTTPAVSFTREMDIIHRAVGPGGLVLVGEGDPRRVKQMLSQEAKRHGTAGHKVPVTTIVMGDGQGQVPLRQLTDHIKKLPKVLDAAQVDDLSRRLKALDAVKSRMPIPKGPMPNARGARSAMRGR